MKNRAVGADSISAPKGITLIALVITILILLILAAVTINLVFSDTGIILKAITAKNKYKEAEVSEKLQNGLINLQINKEYNAKLIDINEMQEPNSKSYLKNFKTIDEIKENDINAKVFFENYYFIIYEDLSFEIYKGDDIKDDEENKYKDNTENWNMYVYEKGSKLFTTKEEFQNNGGLVSESIVEGDKIKVDIEDIDSKWIHLKSVIVCKRNINLEVDVHIDDDGLTYLNNELVTSTTVCESQMVTYKLHEGYNLLEAYINENEGDTFLRITPDLISNDSIIKIIPFTEYKENILDKITDNTKPNMNLKTDELGNIIITAEDSESGICNIKVTQPNNNIKEYKNFANKKMEVLHGTQEIGKYVVEVTDLKGNINTQEIQVDSVFNFDDSWSVEYYTKKETKVVKKEDFSNGLNILKEEIIQNKDVNEDMPYAENMWIRLRTMVISQKDFTTTEKIRIDDDGSLYLNGELKTEISGCGTKNVELEFKRGVNILELYISENTGKCFASFEKDLSSLDEIFGICSVNRYIEQICDNNGIDILTLEKLPKENINIIAKGKTCGIKSIEIVTPTNVKYFYINNDIDLINNKNIEKAFYGIQETGVYNIKICDYLGNVEQKQITIEDGENIVIDNKCMMEVYSTTENRAFKAEDFTPDNLKDNTYIEETSGIKDISYLQRNVEGDNLKIKTTFYIVCSQDFEDNLTVKIDDFGSVYINKDNVINVTDAYDRTKTQKVTFKKGYNLIEIYWCENGGDAYVQISGDFLNNSNYIGITSQK